MKDKEENRKAVERYANQWRARITDPPFTCYYNTIEYGDVIVEKMYTQSDVIHSMFWPSLVIVICCAVFLRLETRRHRLTFCGHRPDDDTATTAAAAPGTTVGLSSSSRKSMVELIDDRLTTSNANAAHQHPSSAEGTPKTAARQSLLRADLQAGGNGLYYGRVECRLLPASAAHHSSSAAAAARFKVSSSSTAAAAAAYKKTYCSMEGLAETDRRRIANVAAGHFNTPPPERSCLSSENSPSTTRRACRKSVSSDWLAGGVAGAAADVSWRIPDRGLDAAATSDDDRLSTSHEKKSSEASTSAAATDPL